MLRIGFTTLLLCLLIPGVLFARQLNLAVDDRYWYPFTYIESSVAKGMHIDIVKQALTNLGYDVSIKAIPRKRSVKYADSGKIDGVISIAYNPDIARQIDFPPDAPRKRESRWRIMQVDHMVITHSEKQFDYNGKISTLPNPVRLPLGENFTDRLKTAGLSTEETKTDLQNFRMMMRDKKGCVISASVIAESIFKQEEFKNKITIQHTPLLSQSYHLAFSPKANISSLEKKKIWDEIASLRDNYVYMLQIFAHY